MDEVHGAWYSIHPGTAKIYRDLREIYWWNGMKKDIAEFVAKCAMCQQVKVELQRPGSVMQEFGIPTWKWEVVKMDFVIELPLSRHHHDSIWVVMDILTKSAYFLPMHTSYTMEDYA